MRIKGAEMRINPRITQLNPRKYAAQPFFGAQSFTVLFSYKYAREFAYVRERFQSTRKYAGRVAYLREAPEVSRMYV